MNDDEMTPVERFESRDHVFEASRPHESVIVVIEERGQSENPKTFPTSEWRPVARIPSSGGDTYVFVPMGGDGE